MLVISNKISAKIQGEFSKKTYLVFVPCSSVKNSAFVVCSVKRKYNVKISRGQ